MKVLSCFTFENARDLIEMKVCSFTKKSMLRKLVSLLKTMHTKLFSDAVSQKDEEEVRKNNFAYEGIFEVYGEQLR